MQHNQKATLQDFLDTADEIDNSIELLESATTEEEYDQVKANHLIYFLDGTYKDNKRANENYQSGKQLIVLDLDDANYEREEIEDKLEEQGLFGLIYPTARYYFDGSKRWRLILMADKAMTLETYKATVEGVVQMLDLGEGADAASSKIAQLMGYPFRKSDVSIVIGTKVNVNQFKKQIENKNVLKFEPNQNYAPFKSNKSLMDFNHEQARLLKEAYHKGLPEGRRNDGYRQIVMYLRDTLDNAELSHWHGEAQVLLDNELENLMSRDGLPEKEMGAILR